MNRPDIIAEQTRRIAELESALQAARRTLQAELATHLEKYFNEWKPRMRTGSFAAGDWQWLAEHLVAIAVASRQPELSDCLRAKRDAALRALAAREALKDAPS